MTLPADESTFSPIANVEAIEELLLQGHRDLGEQPVESAIDTGTDAEGEQVANAAGPGFSGFWNSLYGSKLDELTTF